MKNKKDNSEKICANCGKTRGEHPISVKNGIGMSLYYVCKKFIQDKHIQK